MLVGGLDLGSRTSTLPRVVPKPTQDPPSKLNDSNIYSIISADIGDLSYGITYTVL